MRGLPQKLGQLVSTVGGDPGEVFAPLRGEAEPLPWSEVESLLEAAWGQPVDAVVSFVEGRGLAASLGQVHRAVLRTGEEVAVKVAYPGIDRAVRSDLKLMGWAGKRKGGKAGLFDMGAYQRELARDLSEELDYAHEAAAQEAYQETFADDPQVIVPKVHPQWCRPGVLVTSWIDGATLGEVESWPEAARKKAATVFLRHVTESVFGSGFLHGDLHPGNYRFQRSADGDVRLVLYDFGSTLRLDDDTRLLLLSLICGVMKRQGSPLAVLVALGFDADLLRPIGDRLPALCHTVLQPFATMGSFHMGGWNRRERVDDLLQDQRWNLRIAGPAQLILVMRALHGVFHCLERLHADVPWQVPLLPILTAHEAALDGLSLPEVDGDDDFDSLASHLRITVTQGDEQKVSLALPASAIERLDTVLDQDLSDRIRERGISIDDVVRRARRNGYGPGELFVFSCKTTGRLVRMWLE